MRKSIFVFAAFSSLLWSLLAAAGELRKYGQATTFYLPLLEPAGVNFATAAACVAGDVQISKDGGAFVNTTNCFVNEGNGIYSVALTAAEMQAGVVIVTLIDQTATKVWLDDAVILDTYGDAAATHEVDLDAHAFASSQQTIGVGTVDTSAFTATNSQFESGSITDVATGHYNGRIIIFVTGALAKQAATITNYSLVGGKGHFTTSGFTSAPANGATFVIL